MSLKVYSVTNLMESTRAFVKPSAMSMFSQISAKSGLIMAQLRKSALRFSGNSVRPAYPGFMVIKNPVVGT